MSDGDHFVSLPVTDFEDLFADKEKAIDHVHKLEADLAEVKRENASMRELLLEVAALCAALSLRLDAIGERAGRYATKEEADGDASDDRGGR